MAKTELDSTDILRIKDAEKVFNKQHAIAQRFDFFMPRGDEPSPTEEYLGLLTEYGLPYLPDVIMQDLEINWQRITTLRLSGQAILKNPSGRQIV